MNQLRNSCRIEVQKYNSKGNIIQKVNVHVHSDCNGERMLVQFCCMRKSLN